MLSGANGAKYNNLKRNMKENFVTGTSRYPESPKAVLRILNAYQPPAGWNRRKQDTGAGTEEGTMFAQAEGGDDSWKARINCHKCGKKGHITRECPKKEEEQMQSNIEQDVLTEEEDIDKGENIFIQHKERGVVNKNWVLLDSQSTVNQIANPAFLSNIRKAKKPARVHCNAGSTYSSLEGEFGTLTVKHNPKSIANVLSLHQAKDCHRVTYNSLDRGGVFQVHTQDGIVEFKPCERGLHYHDMSNDESNIGLMLVNTVRGNFEGYTHKEIERAREARRIQGMIANPTERKFSPMVREKLLANCPVTVQDVNNAHHIYGRDLANIRGKTTRRKPEHVQIDYVQIPRDFVKMHKYVTLAADVMFVNGLHSWSPCQEE
jgi:hypothetical protein